MTQELAAALLKRKAALEAEKQPHITVWQECFQYTYPLRGSGFYGNEPTATSALSQIARLIDPTGTDAARVLASGVMSGMTPSNAEWFEMEVDNQSDDEQKFLSEAARLLWKNIHSSNFDSAAFEGVLDCVISGWFALYIEEAEGGGLAFDHWHISDLLIAASKPGGMVDTVYRSFKLTAEQAVNEYGEDNVSQEIRDCSEKDPDKCFEFLHCLYPRRLSIRNARRNKNLPVASVTLECKNRKIVRESGYHEMPVVVPRWMLIPKTNYAVGPVYDALPSMRLLNKFSELELAAADIAVSGMWIVQDDGVLNPRQIKVGPRKIIVAASTDSMKPLVSGVDFNVAWNNQAKLQAAIRRILMADQLQPADGPAMTATEVHVRVELIRQLLGPIYGRLQAEYLQPLIARCFGLAFRAGIFGPVPESLANRSFSIKYISPLARSQKLEEATSIQRIYEAAGLIAQAKGGDMSVFDNLNDDEAIRVSSQALAVVGKVIRTADEVSTIRKQKADSAQQQQAQGMQNELGMEAGKAAISSMTKTA